MGGSAGEAASRPPRSGGAKARKREPKIVEPHQLRKCWQRDRQFHWREIHNTEAVTFASDAARFRWGTAAEIPDVRNGYQVGKWVYQCRECLGEELGMTPSKSI